jgi:hypothetical protein
VSHGGIAVDQDRVIHGVAMDKIVYGDWVRRIGNVNMSYYWFVFVQCSSSTL